MPLFVPLHQRRKLEQEAKNAEKSNHKGSGTVVPTIPQDHINDTKPLEQKKSLVQLVAERKMRTGGSEATFDFPGMYPNTLEPKQDDEKNTVQPPVIDGWLPSPYLLELPYAFFAELRRTQHIHVRCLVNDTSAADCRSAFPLPLLSWQDAHFPNFYLQYLQDRVFAGPTDVVNPMQANVMPSLFQRFPTVAIGPYGSGRRLACLLPLLTLLRQQLEQEPQHQSSSAVVSPRLLVLVSSKALEFHVFGILKQLLIGWNPRHRGKEERREEGPSGPSSLVIVKSAHDLNGNIVVLSLHSFLAEFTPAFVGSDDLMSGLSEADLSILHSFRYVYLDEMERLLVSSKQSTEQLTFLWKHLLRYEHVDGKNSDESEEHQVNENKSKKRGEEKLTLPQRVIALSSTSFSAIRGFCEEQLINPKVVVQVDPTVWYNVLHQVEFVPESSKLTHLLTCLLRTPPAVLILVYKKTEMDLVLDFLKANDISAVNRVDEFEQGIGDVLVGMDHSFLGKSLPPFRHIINFQLPYRDLATCLALRARLFSGKSRRYCCLMTTLFNRGHHQSAAVELRNVLVGAGYPVPRFLKEVSLRKPGPGR